MTSLHASAWILVNRLPGIVNSDAIALITTEVCRNARAVRGGGQGLCPPAARRAGRAERDRNRPQESGISAARLVRRAARTAPREGAAADAARSRAGDAARTVQSLAPARPDGSGRPRAPPTVPRRQTPPTDRDHEERRRAAEAHVAGLCLCDRAVGGVEADLRG